MTLTPSEVAIAYRVMLDRHKFEVDALTLSEPGLLTGQRDRHRQELEGFGAYVRCAYIAAYMLGDDCATLTTGERVRIASATDHVVRLSVYRGFHPVHGHAVFSALDLIRDAGRTAGSDPSSPTLLNPTEIARLVRVLESR